MKFFERPSLLLSGDAALVLRLGFGTGTAKLARGKEARSVDHSHRYSAHRHSSDEDSYNGDDPKGGGITCGGHRLGNGLWRYSDTGIRKLVCLPERYLSEDNRPLGKEPSSGEHAS